MLGSALELAADISQRRSRNEFALLVWQLGEVWPTGGWGSLEYGPAPGFTAGTDRVGERRLFNKHYT